MKLKKPFFWKNINLISILFYPLSLITYAINFFKNTSNKKKFNIKSICVGNIYVGGTGKTPLAIKINKILNKKFKSIFIKKKYDYQLDEQKLLKQNGKLISVNNRSTGLKNAINKKFDLAIFDDGLQDKKIKYDVSCIHNENINARLGPMRSDNMPNPKLPNRENNPVMLTAILPPIMERPMSRANTGR